MLLRLDGEGPIYEQVYRAIRTEILSGRLSPGRKIPSTRELARLNEISRNRIVLAYEQLLLEGYLSGKAGSGTYVAFELPERLSFVTHPSEKKAHDGFATVPWSRAGRRIANEVPFWTTRRSSQRHAGKPPLRYDFRYGRLLRDDTPLETWSRLLARARRASVTEVDYHEVAGASELRAAIAEYVTQARGVRCTAEQVVVVNGSQHGLDLVSRMLLDPGDRVVIEEVHYPGARASFLAAGARLVPVAVDREGLETSNLRRPKRARLAYVTPSHQYPLGGVMPLHRRLALLAWAEEV
ncbi:MAG: PLP-dependent aminotransferase family protein, partial [Candidatus Binatia bacterium]